MFYQLGCKTLNLLNEIVARFWSRQLVRQLIVIPRVLPLMQYVILLAFYVFVCSYLFILYYIVIVLILFAIVTLIDFHFICIVRVLLLFVTVYVCVLFVSTVSQTHLSGKWRVTAVRCGARLGCAVASARLGISIMQVTIRQYS